MFLRPASRVCLRWAAVSATSLRPAGLQCRLPPFRNSLLIRSFASASPAPFKPINVTVENFDQLLSDPSLFVLDCYANWCDPCRVLTPLLEKVLARYKGKIRLGLFDVESNREMAQYLGVSSLPTVIFIAGGEARQRFSGLIEEKKLVTMIEALIDTDESTEAETEPTENSAEGQLAKANQELEVLLAASGTKTAVKEQAVDAMRETFESIAKAFPNFRAQAAAGIVQCYLLLPGGAAKAAEVVAEMRKDSSKVVQKALTEPAVARVFAMVDFNDDVKDVTRSVEELRAAVTQDPNDIQALYDLAVLSFVGGNYEDAINFACKAQIKNKKWKDEAPKKLLQKMLTAMGTDHPQYAWARKRFMNVVYL